MATVMLEYRLVDTSGGKLVDNSVDAGDEGGDYDVEVQAGGHKWREVGGQFCWNTKLIIENIRICGHLSKVNQHTFENMRSRE